MAMILGLGIGTMQRFPCDVIKDLVEYGLGKGAGILDRESDTQTSGQMSLSRDWDDKKLVRIPELGDLHPRAVDPTITPYGAGGFFEFDCLHGEVLGQMDKA